MQKVKQIYKKMENSNSDKIYTSKDIKALVIHKDWTTAYDDNRQEIVVRGSVMSSKVINHLEHYNDWVEYFVGKYGDKFKMISNNGNNYCFEVISEKYDREVEQTFEMMSNCDYPLD